MSSKPVSNEYQFVRGCRHPRTVEQSLVDTIAWWKQYLFQKKSRQAR
jgi:hypothetical protein